MGAARFCRAGRVWAAGWLVGATTALPAAPPPATGPATVEATPLTGFTLTGFGADGFKTWDLQGKQALVQPPGQSEDIPIKNLQLRLFNGGEPLTLESTIESPEATVHPRDSVAKGPGFLYIKSESYTVVGRDWDWDGKQHLIHVGREVLVTFVSETPGPAPAPGPPPPQPVTIHSDHLEIQEGTDQNHFLFSGNVVVTEGQGQTNCRRLEVFAGRAGGAPGAKPVAAPAAPGVGQIERILAHENVVVHQDELEAWGQEAVITPTPGDQRVVLSGAPIVRDHASDAVLTGDRVTWWRDRHELQVDPTHEAGELPRVHISLPPLASYQSEAPKPVAQGPDAPRLLVSGESLHAYLGERERNFIVDHSVHVQDPSLSVDTDHLEATFDALAPVAAARPALVTGAAPHDVGRLNHLLAQGSVVIHQPERRTTAQQAEIFPLRGEVVLSGSPQVEDSQNQAVITGNKIVLLTDAQSAMVTGTPDERAALTLPALPGLGVGGKPGAETHVTSDKLTMNRGTEFSQFVFTGQVKITGQDMETTCASLQALTRNVSPVGAPAAANPLGETGAVGQVQRLLARGQVVIHQRDYEAHAATADIYPKADVAEDGAAAVSAAQPHRVVELHGDPAGLDGPPRPQVILPPMGSLGWDMSGNGTSPAPTSAQPTVITSDEQELLTSPKGNEYLFDGHVQIDGGDMNATCDQMTVFAKADGNATTAAPVPAPPSASVPTPAPVAAPAPVPTGASAAVAATPTASGPAAIQRIVAQGHVRIVQGSRTATAGQAEILPVEGIVILTQQPQVVDSNGGSTGDGVQRIVLHRGERNATFEGGDATPTTPASRPSMIFPDMPDLNFDKLGQGGNKPPANPPQP